MKKQVRPTIKAHLIRSAFCLLLLLGMCAFSFALAQRNATSQRVVSQRALTFAERVAYQRASEGVYWRHRIWPKESPGSKPSLDAMMSQPQLEEKSRRLHARVSDAEALLAKADHP